MKSKLKQSLRDAVEAYTQAFIDILFNGEDKPEKPYYYWVGDDPTGTLCVNEDYFFSLGEVYDAVNASMEWEARADDTKCAMQMLSELIFKWYDSITTHCDALDMRDGHPNLENWLRGAPYDNTEVKKIQKMKQELSTLIDGTKEKMCKRTYIVQDRDGKQRAKFGDGFKALEHIQKYGSKENPLFVEINYLDDDNQQ